MQYKPMLDKNGVCIYLEKTGDIYVCKIQASAKFGDFTRVRRPSWVPKIHWEYWLRECKPYPDPDSDAHVPPVHQLLEGCGFRMVKIDGE